MLARLRSGAPGTLRAGDGWSDTTSGVPPVAPVKRGRGRPRKSESGVQAPPPGVSVHTVPTEGGPRPAPALRVPAPTLHVPALPNPLAIFRGGETLSVSEIAVLRPLLLEALTGYSEYLDGILSKTNKAHAESMIWSSMTADEIETLVDTLLLFGKRSAQVALVAREISRSWHMVKVGMILAPRFYATMRFYADNGGLAIW